MNRFCKIFRLCRVRTVDDVPTLIDVEKANAIEFYLIQNGYVDMKRKVTDKYRQEVKNGTVAEFPEELKSMAEGIHTLIQAVYDDSVLKDMFTDGHETKITENPLNENFAKKEFQALWKEINHKYAYTVEFDSTIFTAEKNTQSFEKAFLAKKAIQNYVLTDGSADKSIERKFAEDLDAAEEVCVYAKLPRTFQIPTPVGNYSPDWAIAFYEGKVKHIFFIAETKGTMESLNLRPIEQAKISCAKKLFNEMSTSKVKYHDVDSYQSLLDIIFTENPVRADR